MKKFLAFLFCGLMLVGCGEEEITQTIEDGTIPITGYITDYADVISDSTEEFIEENSKTMYKKTGTRCVFVLEESITGYDIKEVANNTFKRYGLDEDDILSVITTRDAETYIVKGSEISEKFTDSVENELLPDMIKINFSEGNYSEGLKEYYESLEDLVYNDKDLLKSVKDYRRSVSVGKTVLFISSLFPISYILFMLYIVSKDKKGERVNGSKDEL